tara:strand:- start:40 stop:273 length:234 start_codon:yes stop_codon:yes gene_type:complete
MIVSKLEWSMEMIANTGFADEQAFIMASRTEEVTGNEPGAGRGLKIGKTVLYQAFRAEKAWSVVAPSVGTDPLSSCS